VRHQPTVGIISGLWFTAVSLRSETKTRRIANLLTITANYREVWKELFNSPELARVIDPDADLAKRSVTPQEQLFVGQVISHINSVFYATNDDLVVEWEGWRRDIAQFLSLPIPKAVWSATKLLQNQDFAAFIESCLK
jgi:hypothetical protein